MKKILNICMILLMPFYAVPVAAQQIYDNQINVTGSDIKQVGNNLQVHMALDVTNLKMDRNRSLTLTPILTGKNKTIELPEIMINGTTRHKVYLRSVALSKNEMGNKAPYEVIKLTKENKGVIHYNQTIPYESWMDNVRLDIKEDLCGCGGHEQVVATERITERIIPPVYEMQPELAYIQPEVEKVKSRNEKREMFLDFPVSKTDILPDYMSNQKELSLLESMLKAIETDKNIKVTRIDIVGFASPEGSVSFNEKLSKGRAESLKKYLGSRSQFPASIYNIVYGGENWDGLAEAVEKSNLAQKAEILDIIKNTDNVELRKTKLKALGKGVPYRQMLTEIYPKLRKVICTAYYDVRDFVDISEAKEVLKTRPQHLSMNEMYRVANTYTKGSDDFTDVFETAVRMFPNDNTANLNAAAAALSTKDITKAEKYLDRADHNSAEYANNMGVLYMIQGDLVKAKDELSKASQKGSSVAKHNLQEVEKKVATQQK